MSGIAVAGAGAIGASVAYHLALTGARDVVLCDRGEAVGGATSKGMGGVRQQFSTAAEVRLAQASIEFFESLGPPYFSQVGYLFLATTEDGLASLEERRAVQRGLGVPVERVDPSLVRGLRTDDVLGAVFCRTDGVGDPPAVTRELLRRASALGVEIRERTAVEEISAETYVIACGAWSSDVARRFGVELPVRPLRRQLLRTSPLAGLPDDLPMTIEAETTFHFRRRDDRLVVAMVDSEPRWGWEQGVDESVFDDRLARLAHRYPPAAGATIETAWSGFYDMTPDAHPILGRIADRLYAACGFSGHGFMQSPAVGRALAEEILEGESSFDLSPYRLERFSGGAIFPETAVL
ncbi:MAG: FAD-binding oxidoreductase [Thermoleophilia bacterium]|nr:FAD-binding oxidoreductase [Thermoleophilia bacterium]MDQ3857613.1 FAD-binding oxidoreductase [Actinomycetota bacterium]